MISLDGGFYQPFPWFCPHNLSVVSISLCALAVFVQEQGLVPVTLSALPARAATAVSVGETHLASSQDLWMWWTAMLPFTGGLILLLGTVLICRLSELVSLL